MPILPETPTPELEPGETLVAAWYGDHIQESMPQRGVVALTDRRIAFRPHDLGLLLKTLGILGGTWRRSGDAWSIPLSEVVGVTAGEITTRLTEKGLPLTLTLRNGETAEFFFVHEYANAVEKIQSALAPT